MSKNDDEIKARLEKLMSQPTAVRYVPLPRWPGATDGIEAGSLWKPFHATKVYKVLRIDSLSDRPDFVQIQKVGPNLAEPRWVSPRWFEKAERMQKLPRDRDDPIIRFADGSVITGGMLLDQGRTE